MKKQRAAVPVVKVVNQQITTTSLNVASVFEKEHKNVLQAIVNLEIPNDFRQLNFQPVNIVEENAIGGKVTKTHYQMTRDGFTLLVMGFTGAKAIKFKLAYIDAFNQMEAELNNNKALPPPSDLALTLERHEKRCSGCRQAKSISEFNRDLATADGVATYCRTCARIKQKEHKARNRERNLAVAIQTQRPDAAIREAIASERERALRQAVRGLIPPVVELMRHSLKVAKSMPAGHLYNDLLDNVEQCVSVQEMILHVLNESRVS